MATERIIMAGFGGQGVMSMGQLLTYAGMIEDKQVSWLPAYGPEMRGGTANCSVIVSDSLVGSPIITMDATCAIVMNLPSMLKFEKSLLPGGKLIINTSLVDREPSRDDIEVYRIPANAIADEVGNTACSQHGYAGRLPGVDGIVIR
jgi:2-oxoglutarate ferredoxin oxidoreductase subunit gamma